MAKRLILASVIFAIAALYANALSQNDVADLSDLLAKGNVTLAVKGNGSSSGSAIVGTITNTTTRILHISVYLRSPIYFKNANSGGQNMFALEIYLGDGGYYEEDSIAYIELESKSATKIAFIGFCADFEKENPSGSDGFTVSTAPINSRVSTVLSRGADYLKKNPENENATVAVQIAIWLASGETIDHIGEKFDYASKDLELAKSFLK